MKHNLLRIFCATFLLCFYSAARSQTSSYQCYHQESEDTVGIETYLPLRSYNGVGHTPQGDLKMMLVFVTFIEDDTIPGTDNLSSVWPKNSLPVYASGYPNNLLDSSRHYPSGYKT